MLELLQASEYQSLVMKAVQPMFSVYNVRISNLDMVVTNQNKHLSAISHEPQGSVLGPLLFLLYINDIANSVKKHPCKIMLFADDTNVFIVHKHPIMLKQLAEVIMSDLCDWFITNRRTRSLEKTNFKIFHSPKKKIPSILCKIPRCRVWW